MSETAHSAATKGSKSWALSLAHSTVLKWVGLALFLAAIVAYIILRGLDIRVAVGHPILLPIFNTLFITLISFLIAYFAGRTFLHTGERLLWLAGAGSLVLGASAAVGGWLTEFVGNNISVTVHSVGFLGASALYAASGIMALATAGRPMSPGARQACLIGFYGGGLAFLFLVLAGSSREILPAFFVPGLGGTPVREAVVNITASLLAIAGLVTLVRYSQSWVGFAYWYSLGLLMLALGVWVVGDSRVMGDPIGWLSRAMQWLGSVYLGFGVLAAVTEARVRGLGFNLMIARLFPEYAANYRLLFDTATDAVVALDDGSRVLLWNAAATRIFGYTPAEAIGARLADLLFPDDSNLINGEINNLTNRESQVKRLELEARRKDGQAVPVEISLSGRMTPSGWLSAVVIRDITERKQAEAAIEKGEKQMRHLFDSSIIGIIVADSSDTVIEANDAFLDMVGYSREDLVAGRINWLEMTPPEYRHLDEQAAEELFTEGHCAPFEKEYIRKDGSRVPILISGSLWDTSTDNPTWITFIVDITKRREAQRKLEEYQRLATIGQISGSIAHELRNPLGVVDSSAYYLQRNLPDASERIKAHLQRMRDAVGRSVAIIETLLRLTQMREPRFYAVDLKALIPHVVADCSVPQLVETAHSFCDGDVSVRGDQEQLRIAFRNIITNAVQAMDSRGTLKIEVRAHDGVAEVCFADSGPGIPPENLGRIFEPLFTTKARGIGLGLTLTRNIIEKHQGTIRAESEIGKGATFVVCLPLHENGNPVV